MQIDSIQVTPRYPDTIHVEWTVDNPSIKDDYKFFVFVSESPTGEFEQVNTLPLVNQFSFIIPSPLLYKQEYQFVKVVGEVDDHTSESQAKTFTTFLPKRSLLPAMDIIRRKELQRKVFTGVECTVRKKKVNGEKCNKCVDKATGYTKNSHCLVCFGTGIVGGFLEGIESPCEIVEGDRNIKPSEIGVIENVFAVAQMTFPLVLKGDVIIEKHRNMRWLVNSVQRQMLKTFPIDQKIEIRAIAPKDIEYKL